MDFRILYDTAIDSASHSNGSSADSSGRKRNQRGPQAADKCASSKLQPTRSMFWLTNTYHTDEQLFQTPAAI